MSDIKMLLGSTGEDSRCFRDSIFSGHAYLGGGATRGLKLLSKGIEAHL